MILYRFASNHNNSFKAHSSALPVGTAAHSALIDVKRRSSALRRAAPGETKSGHLCDCFTRLASDRQQAQFQEQRISASAFHKVKAGLAAKNQQVVKAHLVWTGSAKCCVFSMPRLSAVGLL
jgi:hypothetical protein